MNQTQLKNHINKSQIDFILNSSKKSGYYSEKSTAPDNNYEIEMSNKLEDQAKADDTTIRRQVALYLITRRSSWKSRVLS